MFSSQSWLSSWMTTTPRCHQCSQCIRDRQSTRWLRRRRRPIECGRAAIGNAFAAIEAVTRKGSLLLGLEFPRCRIDLAVGEPVARIGNELGLILRCASWIMCLAVLNLRQRLLIFVSVPRIMRPIVCQDMSPLCRKGNSVDSIPFQGGGGRHYPAIVQIRSRRGLKDAETIKRHTFSDIRYKNTTVDTKRIMNSSV